MCMSTTKFLIWTKDWNELIWSRKEVKSSDQYVCGNVMAEYKDKIIIIEGDTIKLKVDHYDENDLHLKISRHDMILNFEFWRSVKS